MGEPDMGEGAGDKGTGDEGTGDEGTGDEGIEKSFQSVRPSEETGGRPVRPS
jgi:hypothetical protein